MNRKPIDPRIPRRQLQALAAALVFSHWLTQVRDEDGNVKSTGVWMPNLTTDAASGYTNRRDWQAKAMGGGIAPVATLAGTATAVTGTVLTNAGASFPTAGQALAGQIVAACSDAGSNVYGIIMSNTSTALTIDQWYSAGTGALGTTPAATAKYQVLPGQAPAQYLAVTADVTAPTSSETTLISEATANGFARKVATYSHTAAASTYLLSTVFTATGSLTPANYGNFGASSPTGGGVLPFKSAIGTPPAMLSGDTLTLSATITIN